MCVGVCSVTSVLYSIGISALPLLPLHLQGPLCRHPCPPYALAWGSSTIMAAGCDKRVLVYSTSGELQACHCVAHSASDVVYTVLVHGAQVLVIPRLLCL